MPNLAAFLRMGILPGGGDVAMAESFLDHLWVSGCQVEEVAAGMTQGMAGDSRPFESGLYQICIHDVVYADP